MKLNGTEKQIKWAEEIKDTVLAIIAEAIIACQNSNINYKQKESFIEQMNILKCNIENANYAGDIISVFAHVKHTGDYKKDISSLKSAIRIGDVDGVFSKPIVK